MITGVSRVITLVFAVTVMGADLYKWVDEEGVTHYSDTPAGQQKAQKLDIKPVLTPGPEVAKPLPKTWQEQEQELQKHRAERERKERQARAAVVADDGAATFRAPLKAGRYVTTTSTSVSYAMRGDVLCGRLQLTIKGNPTIEREAWLKAVFLVPLSDMRDTMLLTNPDPLRQAVNVPEDGLLRIRPGEEVSIQTPEVAHLRCVYYEADILIFRDDRGSELLEEHIQGITGWIDGTKVRSSSQLNAALDSANGKKCAP